MIIAGVTCKISLHAARLDDMKSTCSLSALFISTVLGVSSLLRDWTINFLIIPMLLNLPAASVTLQSVSSSHPNRLHWAYHEVTHRAREKLGSHLSTELDTKVDMAVRQQLDRRLPAVLEAKVRAKFDFA